MENFNLEELEFLEESLKLSKLLMELMFYSYDKEMEQIKNEDYKELEPINQDVTEENSVAYEYSRDGDKFIGIRTDKIPPIPDFVFTCMYFPSDKISPLTKDFNGYPGLNRLSDLYKDVLPDDVTITYWYDGPGRYVGSRVEHTDFSNGCYTWIEYMPCGSLIGLSSSLDHYPNPD